MKRWFLVGALIAATLGLSARPAHSVVVPTADHSVPAFAYYYIWFDQAMWKHAIDLPLLGPYSSDDANVMKQQVTLAKQAGLDGFIVSWKNTPVLDHRLKLLIDVATAQHFALEIEYEGLDFNRKPLPVATVASDMQYFVQNYAQSPPFHYFSKPLIIWSGTWMFSAGDIQRVTEPVRPNVLVLASEKNVDGFERVAGSVDGDAYYWSSVDPSATPGYLEKLVDLSNAVHRHGGLWIAPAAPGFDARKVGGTSVVKRNDGATLEREVTTASASAPDALGVISWNEFSENTYIEPSRQYGYSSLTALSESLAKPAQFPTVSGPDSTDSSASGNGWPLGLIVAPTALILAGLATFVLLRRDRRARAPRRSAPAVSRQVRRERRRRRRAGGTALQQGPRPTSPAVVQNE